MKLTAEQKQANKEIRIAAKKDAAKVAKVEAEINQKPVHEMKISIEWIKSKTWGLNPRLTAQIRFQDGSYADSETFTASGCGYDKESTVIASLFNAYMKYKLYQPLHTEKPYGIHNEEFKYFDGGIGTNCYYRIAEAIGGKFETIATGKTYGVYTYTEPKI